jgi:hypothetical protein
VAVIPEEAVTRAADAITRAANHFDARETEGSALRFARAALAAAAPDLADTIASAILRHADENEPEPGSRGYPAWHRHFEAASAVAAKAFGRDNLEADPPSPVSPAGEDEGP